MSIEFGASIGLRRRRGGQNVASRSVVALGDAFTLAIWSATCNCGVEGPTDNLIALVALGIGWLMG